MIFDGNYVKQKNNGKTIMENNYIFGIFPAAVDTFLREKIYFKYPGGGISLRVPNI